VNFGRIENEPIEVYHATEAWSKSKLDIFRRQARYAYRRFVEKSLVVAGPEPADFRIGHAAHTLILEGEYEYAERYAVVPKDAPEDLRRYRSAKSPSDKTVAAIKWWDDFSQANAGKTLLDHKDEALNRQMQRAVQDHPTARQLFAHGIPEISWRVQLGQFPVQCRSDWFCAEGCELTNGEPYIVDLKTCASNDPSDFSNFERNFFSFGYYRQAPFYSAVISEIFGPVKHFFFVSVEKSEPFEVRVFKPTPRAFGMGWDEVKKDLEHLDECYRSGVWPGDPTEVLSIDVPGWYVQKQALNAAFQLPPFQGDPSRN
jgi:hypothetical protein